MYLALYNDERAHITNIDHATYDLTRRVFDEDSFSGEGISEENINNAKICVLCENNGDYKYACFVDTITPDKNERTVKGLDFRTLWDTEILLDYTAENSFDGKLSAIFTKVKEQVFDGEDVAVNKIPVEVVIPEDDTDTEDAYGSYQGTYQFVNAYDFILCYLKYYGYFITAEYDEQNGKIIFTFAKSAGTLDIDLNDFIYELTTSSNTTNKAVATITYDVETEETDEDGNVIYTDTPATDDDGNYVYDDDGNLTYVPKYKARPSTIAAVYYYRNKDNQIIQSDAAGDMDGRIYPVVCKMFESEYLADAQYNAVYELANARYVDNIVIDNNMLTDPVDFADYPLYTMVNVYYDGKLYKTLPISEKQITGDISGENINVKLGFKKILLTEIIKGA